MRRLAIRPGLSGSRLLAYPLLATLVVAVALRWALPTLVERYPQPLLAVLSTLLEQPLQADRTRLHWQGWQPQLTLGGVRLDDQALRIERLSARFRPDFTGNTPTLRVAVGMTGVVLNQPLFADPVVIDRIQGDLDLSRTEDAWRLMPVLSLVSPDTQLLLSGRIDWPDGASPWLDLHADLDGFPVNRVANYLPLALIARKPHLSRWLRQALVEGRVAQGRLRVQGAVDAFPYADGSGEFTAALRVEDMRLAYSPDWPPIEQLQAEVRFNGRGLDIMADQGLLQETPLQSTRAWIDDLAEQTPLNITGRVREDIGTMQRFVAASPLRDTLGPYLSPLRLEGTAELDLSLSLPLVDPKPPNEVAGELRLLGVTLAPVGHGLVLHEVRGPVRFDGQGLRGGELQTLLGDQPLDLDLASDTDHVLLARGSGRLAASDLLGAADPGLDSVVPGRSAWSIDLRLPRMQQGEGLRLRLRSDLEGSEILLPGSLAKSVGQRLPTEIELFLPRQGDPILNLDAGERLTARLVLTPGWQPRQLTARFGGLALGAYELGSVDVHGQHESAQFTVRFAGPGIHGQLVWPHAPTIDNPVWLALDRLALRRLEVPLGEFPSVDYSSSRSPQPLTVSIAEMLLDGHRLGQLNLSAEPEASGYALRDLRLIGDTHRLQAQGFWSRRAGGQATTLQLALQDEQLDQLLAALDWPILAQLSQGRFGLELSWPGGTPTLAGLRGELDLDLGPGRIVGFEPGAGRLLGLINLESLARRLQLDFSDMAHEGFAFDRVAGLMRLERGEAHIDRLSVDGPAADLALSGRVGLVRQDLDLQADVMPQLGSPLAIAGALAGGPIVGAAVLLAHQVLESGLERLVRMRYVVTGTWQQPVVERLVVADPAYPGATTGSNRK